MLTKEIKKLAIELYKKKKKLDALDKEVKERKQKLQEYFDETKEEKIIIEGKNKSLTFSKVDAVSLKFDAAKLKENLRHDIFNQVVAKIYYIPNISDFIKLLKKYNMDPKEFKEFIDIQYIPNPKLIKEFYQRGDIEPGEIDGTFDSKIQKRILIDCKENMKEENE